MKNRHVGLLIVAIAVLLFLTVMSFNNALDTIVNASCMHGDACPMHATLKTQKAVSYSLISLLVVVGAFVGLFMEEGAGEKALSGEERKRRTKKLDEGERKVMEILTSGEGSVYQSDLVKETGLTKVKVTRILDRLEGKSLIERKRRGMTNIVILK